MSADGTRIAVTATGRGRPLVVSPGALCTAQDWQPLADVLASHVTTYAVDRRGHGASGDGTDFSIDREQEDIGAVLDLAGPDAVLLGHSYRGLVALGTAQQRPPTALILALSTWLGLRRIGASRGSVVWVSVVWVRLRQSVR
jgi:pimeloyl-ACP methyl ester carboxylesterase